MIRRLPEQMTDWGPWEGAHGLGVVRIEDEDDDDHVLPNHPFDALNACSGQAFHRSAFPKIAPIGRYGILRVRPP
jgi:hypothetical protein